MAIDFNKTEKPSSFELVPNGALALALFTFKEFKHGASGGRYANIDLTLTSGPFEKRHIFEMLPDAEDARNAAWLEAGSFDNLKRALECAGLLAIDGSPLAAPTFDQCMQALDGKIVAVRVRIEKGKDGHQDKNKADFLSPRPGGTTFKKFEELRQGGTGIAGAGASTAGAARPTPALPFGQPQPQAAPAQPAPVPPTPAPPFGAPATTAVQPASAGWLAKAQTPTSGGGKSPF